MSEAKVWTKYDARPICNQFMSCNDGLIRFTLVVSTRTLNLYIFPATLNPPSAAIRFAAALHPYSSSANARSSTRHRFWVTDNNIRNRSLSLGDEDHPKTPQLSPKIKPTLHEISSHCSFQVGITTHIAECMARLEVMNTLSRDCNCPNPIELKKVGKVSLT